MYGLSMIASSHLTLKEEKLLSVKVVDEGKDIFVWLLMVIEKNLCYHILPLPFVLEHKFGLIGSGKE